MKWAAFLFLSSLFAGSVPSLAASASERSDRQPRTPTEKRICKSVGEDLIGSRLGKSRVCKTAAQWDRELEKQKTGSSANGGKEAGPE